MFTNFCVGKENVYAKVSVSAFQGTHLFLFSASEHNKESFFLLGFHRKREEICSAWLYGTNVIRTGLFLSNRWSAQLVTSDTVCIFSPCCKKYVLTYYRCFRPFFPDITTNIAAIFFSFFLPLCHLHICLVLSFQQPEHMN